MVGGWHGMGKHPIFNSGSRWDHLAKLGTALCGDVECWETHPSFWLKSEVDWKTCRSPTEVSTSWISMMTSLSDSLSSKDLCFGASSSTEISAGSTTGPLALGPSESLAARPLSGTTARAAGAAAAGFFLALLAGWSCAARQWWSKPFEHRAFSRDFFEKSASLGCKIDFSTLCQTLSVVLQGLWLVTHKPGSQSRKVASKQTAVHSIFPKNKTHTKSYQYNPIHSVFIHFVDFRGLNF